MNASVANNWYWFAVVNPHEFISIMTVYGGSISGPYGGLIGGFDGVGGRFVMFLYKTIVIKT